MKIEQGSSFLWTRVIKLRYLKLTERKNEMVSIKMRRSSELGLKIICCKQHVTFAVSLAFQ